MNLSYADAGVIVSRNGGRVPARPAPRPHPVTAPMRDVRNVAHLSVVEHASKWLGRRSPRTRAVAAVKAGLVVGSLFVIGEGAQFAVLAVMHLRFGVCA